MGDQITEAIAAKGPGDLAQLIAGTDTWSIA